MLFLFILQDVPRTFNDILDYYSANGIIDGKSENEDEFHVDKDHFFVVSVILLYFCLLLLFSNIHSYLFEIIELTLVCNAALLHRWCIMQQIIVIVEERRLTLVVKYFHCSS